MRYLLIYSGPLRSLLLGAVLAFFLVSLHAHAAEIEPRAYGNTPVGVNFLILGYVYSDGGLSTPAASPVSDANLKMHTGILAYARSLDVWGMPGKFDIVLPYSSLSGTATAFGGQVERNVSGFNDPRFRFSLIFYGARSFRLKSLLIINRICSSVQAFKCPRLLGNTIPRSW